MSSNSAQSRRTSTRSSQSSRSTRNQDVKSKISPGLDVQQREESSGKAADRNLLKNAIELAISIHFVRLLMAISRGDFEDGSIIIRNAFALANRTDSQLLIALCKFWQGVLFDGVHQKTGACQSFLGAFELVGKKRLESIFMLEYLQQEWETTSDLLENAAVDDEVYAEKTKNLLWEHITKTLIELNSFQQRIPLATSNELRSPLIKMFADDHSPLDMGFDLAYSEKHARDDSYDVDEKTSSSLFRFLHDEIGRDLAPLTPDLVRWESISETEEQSPAQIPLPHSPFIGIDDFEKQFRGLQV